MGRFGASVPGLPNEQLSHWMVGSSASFTSWTGGTLRSRNESRSKICCIFYFFFYQPVLEVQYIDIYRTKKSLNVGKFITQKGSQLKKNRDFVVVILTGFTNLRH